MKSELKQDAKFFAIGIIAGLATLILPVVMWNVWFLDYIDKHGKLVAWLLAPVFALISSLIIVGKTDINRRLFGAGTTNPFWGWFLVALIIEFAFVLLSNT